MNVPLQVMIADYFVTTEVDADFTSASFKVCCKHRYFFVTGGQSPQKFILKRERERSLHFQFRWGCREETDGVKTSSGIYEFVFCPLKLLTRSECE
jgi:hypothetical protein